MLQIIGIALGGALGSVLRFYLSRQVNQWTGTNFPYGTLLVNVVGCFLIGVLSVLLVERLTISPQWRAALLIGFLGGFTTFSSFSLDTFTLYEQGNNVAASLNIGLSLVCCLLATFVGTILGRNI